MTTKVMLFVLSFFLQTQSLAQADLYAGRVYHMCNFVCRENPRTSDLRMIFLMARRDYACFDYCITAVTEADLKRDVFTVGSEIRHKSDAIYDAEILRKRALGMDPEVCQ